MDYQIEPFGNLWDNGMINVPTVIVDKYIRFAGEYQIKALLIIFKNGGSYSSKEIARSLGLTSDDVDELMEFWISEGVIKCFDNKKEKKIESAPLQKEKKEEVKEDKKQKKAMLSAPHLSPKEIVELCHQNPDISALLCEAQDVLGRTISQAEQETFISMNTYYGLNIEIILTILQYYRTQKENGKVIGVSYITKLADNWAEEGINTLSDAEEKLKELESSDKVWDKITEISGIRHRRPTNAQRKMIKEWTNNFSFDMIDAASDIMKENTDKPSLKYVDSILKNWLKDGIKSRCDITKTKKDVPPKKSKITHLEGDASYDMNKIINDTKDNTSVKV